MHFGPTLEQVRPGCSLDQPDIVKQSLCKTQKIKPRKKVFENIYIGVLFEMWSWDEVTRNEEHSRKQQKRTSFKNTANSKTELRISFTESSLLLYDCS